MAGDFELERDLGDGAKSLRPGPFLVTFLAFRSSAVLLALPSSRTTKSARQKSVLGLGKVGAKCHIARPAPF